MQNHLSTDIKLTAVERMAKTELRSYRRCHASTIKLFGEADQHVLPENLRVHYEHTFYEIPAELRADAGERVKRKEAEAAQKNRLFFDGPNVRLIHWTIPLNRGSGHIEERNTLQLTLGPVGWHQFEGTNALIAERLNPEEPRAYEHWVEFSHLIHDFDVRHSRLSNILCNAVTIFALDGKIGYGERGDQQSAVPNQTSCAVAENVNRYFDEVDPDNTLQHINRVPYEMRLSEGPDNRYQPGSGIPHPIAAVRRGLNDETSKHMTDHIPDSGIKLTGLDFGLDTLQPFALWIVLVNLTAEEFKSECTDDPGKAWYEQEIKFVPADFDAPEMQQVLNRNDWVPGGKASFVRAIELIEAIRAKNNISATAVFDLLATAC